MKEVIDFSDDNICALIYWLYWHLTVNKTQLTLLMDLTIFGVWVCSITQRDGTMFAHDVLFK